MRRLSWALLLTALLLPQAARAQAFDPNITLPPLVEAILSGDTSGLDPELAKLLEEPFAFGFGLIYGFVFVSEEVALSDAFAQGIVLTAPGGAGTALAVTDAVAEPGLAQLTASLDLVAVPNQYQNGVSPN